MNNIVVNKYRDKLIFRPYIILFLYFCQGILYPEGSIISQGLIFILLLWGLIAMLKDYLVQKKPFFLSVWTALCVIMIITFILSPKYVYGTVYEAIGKVSTYSQTKDILAYCLSLYIGLNIGRKAVIGDKYIARIGIGILLLSILRYGYEATQNMATFGREVTNNAAYYFTTVIPFLPSIFKVYRSIAIVCILTILSFTIMGAKRGAIVCTLVSMTFYMYWYIKKNNLSFTKLFFCAILIGGIILFAVESFSEASLLQERLEHTERNGIGAREIGYAVMWNHWLYDDNVLTQLFGNGTAQTVTVWGNYGHNDWLELLIDNGLVGVVLYALFFISMAVYVKRTRTMDNDDKLTCFLILIIWFLKTCFSMGFSSVWGAMTMILLGVKIGNSWCVGWQYQRYFIYQREMMNQLAE